MHQHLSLSVSLCLSRENQQWFVHQHLSLLLERNPTGIHSVMFSRSRSVAVSLSLYPSLSVCVTLSLSLSLCLPPPPPPLKQFT